MRFVGEHATNVYTALGSDDWESSSSSVGLENGEWAYPSFVSSSDFSIVEMDNYWDDGTWDNATDSVEVDWVKIELLHDSYWGPWSTPCTNHFGCPISDTTGKSYLQYRVNLSTDDPTSSPSVNSVTLASGYQSSGTFTSQILDAGDMANWEDLTAETETPTGTSITFETRSGNSSTPDDTWSSWQSINSPVASPDKRYLQYKATLSTTDQNQTPILKSVTLTYSGSGFEPTIAIGSNKTYHLSPDETVSIKANNLFFRGNLSNLKYGKIQIYQDGKLIKTGTINKKGNYRIKIKHGNNKTHSYQFKYFNSHGEEINSTPVYQIFTDKRKPRITNLPKKINASPGDTITWTATDNDQIDHYLITFRGQKTNSTDPSFQIPENTPKGLSNLSVRAYDRAGNSAVKKAGVRVR